MSSDSLLDPVLATLRPHMARLSRRRPARYWGDLVVTTSLAWTSFLSGASRAGTSHPAVTALLFVVAVLALYRASAFMHEVTHVRAVMPRYALAWDVLIGVPLLLPSLLLQGVHDTHHDRRIFGTAGDPEYVQHDEGGWRPHLVLLAHFALVPAFLVLRWLVLTPLSLAHAGLRRLVVTRLSSFAGNPRYRRPPPVGAASRRWLVLELACFVWTAIVIVIASHAAVASLVFAALVATCVSVLHGTRSLATHRFRGRGAVRTREEQFLDSVNVTGHPLVTELWAPAGLRYHALHHLAPRLPYHALGEAHGLLLAVLPRDDAYRSVTFDGLADVVRIIVASTTSLGVERAVADSP